MVNTWRHIKRNDRVILTIKEGTWTKAALQSRIAGTVLNIYELNKDEHYAFCNLYHSQLSFARSKKTTVLIIRSETGEDWLIPSHDVKTINTM